MKKLILISFSFFLLGSIVVFAQNKTTIKKELPKKNVVIESSVTTGEVRAEKDKQYEKRIALKNNLKKSQPVQINNSKKQDSKKEYVAPVLPKIKITQTEFEKLSDSRKQYVRQNPAKFEITKQ
jgi:hypothetical protein